LEEENLVKKTCKELGITQKKLSEKTGIATSTLSRWSKDNSKISKTGIKTFSILLELQACRNFYLKTDS
jgi:transcriptional regulator with XRE-family HTH domain